MLNQQNNVKMVIEAVYPDRMSQEEYRRALQRLRARHVARLLVRLFPELLEEEKEEVTQREEIETPSR